MTELGPTLAVLTPLSMISQYTGLVNAHQPHDSSSVLVPKLSKLGKSHFENKTVPTQCYYSIGFHFQRWHDFFYFHNTARCVCQLIDPPSLSVALGIGNHVCGFGSPPTPEVELTRSDCQPWLSFHYFWMEEKHLNRGNRRGWSKLGAWNSGSDGITIHGYLRSVHWKSHRGSTWIFCEVRSWTHSLHGTPWDSTGVPFIQGFWGGYGKQSWKVTPLSLILKSTISMGLWFILESPTTATLCKSSSCYSELTKPTL